MIWHIEDEYLHHETGHHVVVFRNKVSKAQHLVQMLTKCVCPHCGHAASLNADGNVDIQKEKQSILDELNALHLAEVEHINKHKIKAR